MTTTARILFSVSFCLLPLSTSAWADDTARVEHEWGKTAFRAVSEVEIQAVADAGADCFETFFHQVDVRRCLKKKVKVSDAALQEAENRLRVALYGWDEEEKYVHASKTKLMASREAFTRYRAAQCAFEKSLGGNAIGTPMLEDVCIDRENSLRTANLLQFAKEREEMNRRNAKERDAATITKPEKESE
jgi:uncharacterized protein YecT (DUF1311 family)